MTEAERGVTVSELSTSNSNLVGFYSAVLTTVITIVTFGFANGRIEANPVRVRC